MTREHYVRSVADLLKAAEGDGHLIDEIAAEAISTAKTERRDAIARELFGTPPRKDPR